MHPEVVGAGGGGFNNFAIFPSFPSTISSASARYEPRGETFIS